MNVLWFSLILIAARSIMPAVMSSVQANILTFWVFISYLLYFGRKHKRRVFHLAALGVVVLALVFRGKPESETIHGADRVSNTGVGAVISQVCQQNKFIHWNPHIFCGMPTVGSMMATAQSQVIGMPLYRSVIGLYFGLWFAYVLFNVFRFNPSDKEKEIHGILWFGDSHLTPEEAKAFSITVFGFGVPLVIQCVVALIIL